MTTLEETNNSWRNSKINKLFNFLGSCFYIGYSSKFPDTLGSLPGILLFLATKDLTLWTQTLALIIFIMFSIGIAQNMSETADKTGSIGIVIDKVAGMWLALFGLSEPTLTMVALAFLLFRAMDMLKPFPITVFQTFKGGKGIVADDLASGMVVNILIRILMFKGVL